MSVRENIAANLLSVISSISSPTIKKATRQPFILDELSEQQYPAVIVKHQKKIEMIVNLEVVLKQDMVRLIL